MRTTLRTSEDENYTQNEWKWELHLERVEMSIKPRTSGDDNNAQNE